MDNPCSITISKLTFSDHSQIELEENSIIVIVGPNNVGKTQALKDISSNFTNSSNANKCIKSIDLKKQGTVADLHEYLKVEFNLVGNMYNHPNGSFIKNSVNQFNQSKLTTIGFIFAKYIIPDNRLYACNPVSSFDPYKSIAANALQFMLESDDEVDFVSKILNSTFGQSLAIDHRGGDKIRAFMGNVPKLLKGEDRTSASYISRLRKLTPLEEQGHGIRGFAGLVLEALLRPKDISIIDEPEVFLHPPQAKALGKVLAKESSKQLIIATHSSDILRGLIDQKPEKVKIIRLTRSGDVNNASILPSELIAEFWKNPQLKYSNSLEAIFHEKCILVEADSDCRFFNFLSDDIELKSKTRKYPDKIYIPCGGKNGIPKVSRIMHSLKIPTVQVYDIDILSNEEDIKKAVISTGADWNKLFAKVWNILDTAIRSGIKRKTIKQIRRAIVQQIE